ncbi:hypothetical protein XF36_12380 [Pseudonocardia sp. HH130629-09]|nr:hypothetical protein XF36_12380 [Pseudonocardia sp. HH130629-09]
MRARSSSASSSATRAAFADRAPSMSSSTGPDRSACSAAAAADTADAVTGSPRATQVLPCFSSACQSPSAEPLTVRVMVTTRVVRAVEPGGRPRLRFGGSGVAAPAAPVVSVVSVVSADWSPRRSSARRPRASSSLSTRLHGQLQG